MEKNSYLIDCRKIFKIYGENAANQVFALDSVDIKIQHGERVAIIGPSGSGKSTVLQILGLLDVLSSGEYYFEGRDVSKLDDKGLSVLRSQKVGFVFQAFHLLSYMTLVENVALPLIYQGVSLSERLPRAYKALEMVGLEHRVHHNPQEISGGEKQRAAIARAVVHNPVVLFADEPTGNLDSKVKTSIMNEFVKLNEEHNLTMVFVTHDQETAKYAETCISIKDGKIQ